MYSCLQAASKQGRGRGRGGEVRTEAGQRVVRACKNAGSIVQGAMRAAEGRQQFGGVTLDYRVVVAGKWQDSSALT